MALSLQQLALLVFAHLLAALLDHATQQASPLLRAVSPISRARQGLETRRKHVKQSRVSRFHLRRSAVSVPSGNRFGSAADEGTHDQFSRVSERSIHRVSAW